MFYRLTWSTGFLLASVGPAFAQAYEEVKPLFLEKKSTAVEWLIAGVFLVGCMVIAFKPAKRSNLQ